jgi:CspA family cold shock protein
MRGTVKRFFVKEGFGFIRCEDGPDVFVHYKGIEGRRKALLEGEEVEFEIEMGPRTPRACKVKRIRSAHIANTGAKKDRFAERSTDFLNVTQSPPEVLGTTRAGDFRLSRDIWPGSKIRQFVVRFFSMWRARGIR